MIKNIIFDFDGVIADTFDMNWALCQQHAEPATLEDFLAHHDGNVFAEPRIIFNDEKAELFYSGYRESMHPHHVETAVEYIMRLAENHSLFIISSNSEVSISNLLERCNLENLFTKIMGAETHRSKVEKFAMLKKLHDVTSDNAIFITDTLGDIKEAHAAGIRTIAETFGYHDRERLAVGKPFKILDSWDEIEVAISELHSSTH